MEKRGGSSYLAGDGFGRALHLAADFLSGLLKVSGLSNLALHLRRSGAVGRASLLFGSLRDDVAGRCVGGHSAGQRCELVETGKRLDRCSADG